MASESLTVYPQAYSESTLQLVSNGANPVGKGSDNTTYATLRSEAGATTYIRWPFDLSAIPDGAAIDSVACKAKVRLSYGVSATTAGVSATTAKVQISSGSALKGSSVSLPQKPSDSNAVLTVTDAGTWTRDELQSCNLYIEATSKRYASNDAREIQFYGADLTVTYTYQSQKFMLKLGGSWSDASRVFKKVNGIWVEQTDLANVIEDGVRYKNGGEIISPKKTVTITGSGDATYAYVTINGTNYTTATTVEVYTGDEISITVYGNGSNYPGYVTLNGETVLNTSGQYTHTVYSDCTVRLSVAEVSKFTQGSAEISTS